MGIEVERTEFGEDEYRRFEGRLGECLEALASMLARPSFGVGETTVGAELEVSLIDADARALHRNHEVLAASGDSRLTLELDRFNLESNLQYGALEGRPFSALADECRFTLADMNRAAAGQGGRVACIGILPTLRESDLAADTMTDSPRYRALSEGLRRLRQEPFDFDINGLDTLRVQSDDVTFEGAATSFQIHLRVDPAAFAATYNAIQLATAPVLAVAGNSPVFLGRRLWQETRIALFKQAVDSRRGRHGSGLEPRVSFGHRWIEGPLELFEHNVRAHRPLLPVMDEEPPAECLRAGRIPRLRELRLHQGTVWSWNRAIFDPTGGGHLRIEMRALPSGPSVPDMVANAAFHLGLAFALAGRKEGDHGSFEAAHRNFYRAAREGLDAELTWASEPGAPPAPFSAQALVEQLLPLAQVGLEQMGVEPEEVAPLLATVERRSRTGRTGAAWQLGALAAAEARDDRWRALERMMQRYVELQRSGEPVDRWPEGCP